jgi:heat shock protein HtpX
VTRASLRSRPVTAVEQGLSKRVAGNERRAVLLVLLCGAVIGVIVGLLSLLVVAPLGALVVLVVVGLLVAGAAWWGSEPLARRLIGAHPADPIRHARLLNLVEALCIGAGLPQPSVEVIDDPALNALSHGRSRRHATLAVTQGLVDGLSRVELEAVVAHELAHIKSLDILTSTVAVALFGVMNGPARAGAGSGGKAVAASVLLPVSAAAGFGLHLAVDPQQEAEADLNGSSLTRYPPGMVAALEKMRDGGTIVSSASPATAHLWLASPLPPPTGERRAWLVHLFETHPPLEERIEALREL